MSPALRLRYLAEFGAFRVLAAIVRALPVETASNLSGAAWRAIAPRLSRHRRACAHLAAAFPDKTDAERDAIARDMWETLGRTFAEAFHLDEIVADGRISYEPDQIFDALRTRACGEILVSLHFGNWELAAAGGPHAGLKIAGVYQAIKNPYVDAYVNRLRESLYPGGLYAKAPDTATALMRHAKRGGAVALLADLRDRNGASVDFFGRPAPSTLFPALLARSLGLPLLAARVMRLPGVRFRIEVVELDIPRDGERRDDVVAATQIIQRQFESWVRENPSQWMWAHRRWG